MAVQDQLDMDVMAETELFRLQRQYRIMESDRKAFQEEINCKLAKQRKVINTLRKEQHELLQDLKITRSATQKRKDFKISQKLNNLLEDYDKVVLCLKEDKLQLHEIEHQIRKLEKQVFKLRQKEITEHEFRERVNSGKKSVETLENRLENIIKRFCSVLAENKILRKEIDHLLIERSNFNMTWEKLLQNLNNGKKFILDLIEQATIAYDQREEWCSKLQALRVRAQTDLMVHTQEMREVQRTLDHDGKLKEFLSIKGQKRILKDLEEKEMKKRELEKEDMEKQLEVYEKTLETIKELSGEEELEKISGQFIKEEEENFALFNYVNQISHEIENINEEIDQLNIKIVDQKTQNEQRAQEQKDTMESLENELKEAISIADADEKEFEDISDKMNQVLTSIESLFKILSCDEAPILDLLGDHTTINNDNVMVYLGLIEQKISSLVTNLYFKEKSMMKQKKYKKETN